MLKNGEKLDGRYEIIEIIGEGGICRVYKARQTSLGKNVAVKEIKRYGSSSGKVETELLKNLKNDALPVLYDIVETNGHIYTIMELIDGHDIMYLHEHGRKFDESAVKRYGLELCDAVVYLNDHRIIHGDIKPSNVIINAADKISLIDFNISAVISAGHADIRGYSPDFAAPEQREFIQKATEKAEKYENTHGTKYLYTNSDSQKEAEQGTKYLYSETSGSSALVKSGEKGFIDKRTDVYGIASVLWYMMTGHSPVGGMDIKPAGYSKKLINAVRTALEEKPADRWDNAEDFKQALLGKLVKKGSGNSNEKIAAVLGSVCGVVAVIVIAASIGNNIDDDSDGNGDNTGTTTTPFTETTTLKVTEETQPLSETTKNIISTGYYVYCSREYVEKECKKLGIDLDVEEIDSFPQRKGEVLEQYPLPGSDFDADNDILNYEYCASAYEKLGDHAAAALWRKKIEITKRLRAKNSFPPD